MAYKVRFTNTNLIGKPDRTTTGIVTIQNGEEKLSDGNIYSISGQIVRKGSTQTSGLPKGIYIINGKKVVVK